MSPPFNGRRAFTYMYMPYALFWQQYCTLDLITLINNHNQTHSPPRPAPFLLTPAPGCSLPVLAVAGEL